MIAGVLEKILDRCIELLKTRQDQRRRLFEDFAKPLLEDFEILHAAYIESFSTYRSHIDDNSLSLTWEHPVFDMIRRDIVFSAGQREKMRALAHGIEDPLFGALYRALHEYLDAYNHARRILLDSPDMDMILATPNVRWMYYETLRTLFDDRRLSEEAKRNAAHSKLEVLVQTVQTLYGKVLGEYADLKVKLLR